MRIDFACLVQMSLFNGYHIGFTVLSDVLRNALGTQGHEGVPAKVSYVETWVVVALGCELA